MGLYPDEFPEEAREIRNHIEECAECMAELESLGRMAAFLRDHRQELAPAVSPCPPEEAVASLALGEPVAPSIAAHVEFCPECSQCVEAVRGLAGEKPAAERDSLDSRERGIVHRAVEREYGPAPSSPQKAQWEVRDLLWSLFRMPAFAVGAAAVLAVVIWWHVPTDLVLQPVFSEMAWHSARPSAVGHDLVPKDTHLKRIPVAVMIFTLGKEGLGSENLASLYGRIDIPDRVKAAYEVIPPREVKQALVGEVEARDLEAWVRLVFSKLQVEYYLSFQLSRSRAQYSIRAALFQRGRPAAVGILTQEGLPSERIPARISSLGAELLSEVAGEASGKNTGQRK